MKTVLRILGVAALLLFVWYLAADRLTPFTSNARVRAFVTPIVPQVSGVVVTVDAGNGEEVEAGAVLAQLDRRPFEIAVARARADLDAAVQAVGADSAGVAAAQATLSQAEAQVENTRVQTDRVLALEGRGLVSTARGDDARAARAQAESALAQAQAELDRAREQLGPEGADNPGVRRALADLARAKLNLEWTTLRAPTHGGLTNLGTAAGAYAIAGSPLLTFVDTEDVWIEAYLTENNLGHVDVGDRVEVALDMHPGRILEGRVESFGAASATGYESAPGQLARAPRATGWLRDPQRFPVRIIIPGYEVGDTSDDVMFQINGQADVIVYAGDNALLDRLGSWYIRALSWLSYAY